MGKRRLSLHYWSLRCGSGHGSLPGTYQVSLCPTTDLEAFGNETKIEEFKINKNKSRLVEISRGFLQRKIGSKPSRLCGGFRKTPERVGRGVWEDKKTKWKEMSEEKETETNHQFSCSFLGVTKPEQNIHVKSRKEFLVSVDGTELNRWSRSPLTKEVPN